MTTKESLFVYHGGHGLPGICNIACIYPFFEGALINNALFIKTQAVKLMLDTTGCVALLRQSTHLYFPQV